MTGIINFKQFQLLAKQGNLVALSRSLPGDLETPVSSFLKLGSGEDHVFLLESAEQEEKIGRYSIIGLAQDLILQATKDQMTAIDNSGKSKTWKEKSPLNWIRRQMEVDHLVNPEAVPGFPGGFVGYIGYDCVQDFEPVRLAPKDGPGMPDLLFFRTCDFLIFDHFRKSISLVTLLRIDPKTSLLNLYKSGLLRIKKWESKLRGTLHAKRSRSTKPLEIRSNTAQAEFLKKVQKIKKYIFAGDCIQVVLSQRFKMPVPSDDFSIYRALRSINPSPYMFYFRSGKYRLIGSSPELLVRKSGRKVEVRPIAGTRPRGETPTQDAKYAENLKKSVKELAEHLMLVDLGRNDLGRVCDYESVKVTNFARIENYSHVMHLVSDVEGRLRKGLDEFDLVRAVFPAGTVSGAPKIRAMQIIDELEPESRGPYAGCLGYFGFNRDLDMCITIRTLFSNGRNLFLQAGAGIVKDSVPENEYQETLNKAKALLRAVELRGEF